MKDRYGDIDRNKIIDKTLFSYLGVCLRCVMFCAHIYLMLYMEFHKCYNSLFYSVIILFISSYNIGSITLFLLIFLHYTDHSNSICDANFHFDLNVFPLHSSTTLAKVWRYKKNNKTAYSFFGFSTILLLWV